MAEPHTLSEAPTDPVYLELRRLIIEGRYAPGARLIEERLAGDLGVSRTPVRQALTRAAAEGLVRLYPNRGAVVRTFTREDLIQSYDLRAVLEGYAAYQAAKRISPEQVVMLEREAAALEAALTQQFESRQAEVHFLVEHNQVFHNTIIEASGNTRLVDILPLVVDVPLQFRTFYWYTREERRISNFFHRSILHALQIGDAERARAMMQEHIYSGRDFLIKSLEEAANTEDSDTR
ncbi:MAG: GntR family transcriptional regulator [Chloroflexales bacterium]|nr:GntR family transcriptional regulator [Chloroflexales bacterium]